MEVIKHWIDQSDVYLLILGGRYGSIDQETGKSYTHLEYEYALEKEIPIFSCVLRDPDKRAMNKGDINKYLERDNFTKYQDFKKLVTSKMVRFWETSKDIEKSIILTLKDFERCEKIIGWMRGGQQTDSSLIEEKAKLTKKNKELEELLKRERSLYNQKLTKIQSQQKELEQSYQIKINQLQQQLTEAEGQIRKIAEIKDNLQYRSYTIENEVHKQLSKKESQINQLQETIQQLQSSVQKNTTKDVEFTEKIELKSEKGIDYTKLRDLLAAGKWKEADQQTTNVMLKVMGKTTWWSVEISDIDNFPCDDLQTIDQLWVNYSNGKFGFSVQKKIYVDKLGGMKDYNQEIWHEFCDQVGWRKGGNYVSYENLSFELSDITSIGHLPSWGVGREFGGCLGVGCKVSSFAQRLVTCRI